jgi:beta-glucanase (GH16 family)
MVSRGAAMKSKIVFGTIAALLLTLFSFTPVQAAAGVVTAPTISPLANGKSIVATPTKWSATVKSSYKWLLNGKSVDGTKTSFTPTAKQKGATLVYVETATGTTSRSNSLVIGQVFIKGSVNLAFTDVTSTKISVILAPAVPANAKAKVTWFRGPFEVKEATGLTYEVATADQDSEITVSVVYAAKGYTPAKLISTGIVIPMQERKYSLMWSDEFDASASSTVDPSIWVPQNGDGVAFGNKGWGNRERQWYLDTQSKIDSTGALTISATRTGAEALNCYYKAPCEWISSKFVTKDRVGFKYGRIEARIKGSVGTGTWGAFWLLGANIDDRGWPGCGEIDVAELLGRDPKKNYGTLHGPLSGGGGRGDTVAMDNGFANDYHTYAIDWLPDQITWYLDGQLFATVNKTDKDWVFDHEFYLIMNLAMGGIFGGDIDPAVKDATMSFDYVRAYQINGVGEVIKH